MGYESYWLHLFIFRGCSTLTAMFTRIFFPFHTPGRVKSSRRSCWAAWLRHLDVVLLLQGFFQKQQGAQHCSICQPCGTSVLTYVARGQFARSTEPGRISKDSKGGRMTFADGVTSPSLLEADAGLGLFRMFPAMLFVSVHLHLRMSAHNNWDASRARGMVFQG